MPAQDYAAFRRRMRAAGFALFGVSDTAQLVTGIARGEDWLTDLFTCSPIVHAAMRPVVSKWNEQPEPAPAQASPGVWLVPLPQHVRAANRQPARAGASSRRRAGYLVVIIVTAALLDSEQLAAMCQAVSPGGGDLQLCRSMLAQLPPARDEDIGRLTTMIRQAFDDLTQMNAHAQANESLGRQLAESYEEMNLFYTIIQSMTVQERPERFIAIACQELLNAMPFSWTGAQFTDDRQRLKSLAGRFIIARGTPGASVQGEQPAPQLRQAARLLLRQTHADAAMVLETTSNAAHAPFAALGSTVLVHPLVVKGEVLGVLLAGDKRGGDESATNIDLKLLGATATHMSIFLENAALYDDLSAMFMGTLEALTASIDAKDRYTCGHSRRVAHLAQQLANAIGLDDQTVKRVHIAGLVHDVGKIGVPEAVLLKPGKLTSDEFEWIKKHPEIGYRILKDIPQLTDVLPGVLHHHERWDGQGYPHGLAGEGIPLAARLICLADSFDAMSSTRTYRPAMSRRQVLEEITRCMGSQFDPDLAPAFIKLDFAEFDRLVREHHAGDPGPIQLNARDGDRQTRRERAA